MHRASTSRRRKISVHLGIDSNLLEQAKRLKLNLFEVLEAGITQCIRQHEREQWLASNRAALDAYNEHVETHGVFSDGLRTF